MYWSDTKAHTIYAFDFEPLSGAMTGRRVFAQLPGQAAGQRLATYGGRPDGAAVDVEGCYWVAMFEGQRSCACRPTARSFARCAAGALPDDAVLRRPRPEDDLRHQRQPEPAAGGARRFPHAGCTFAFEVDVPGLPVRFAALD